MDRPVERSDEKTLIDTAVEVPEKIGKYQIKREIGRGAMGVVYEGFDPYIKRRVAIKTVRRDLTVSESIADEIFNRFSREAQAAGLINHQNVVTIYDMGEDGNVTYIVMEYVEGYDLKSILKEKKRIPVDEALKIAIAVAQALHEAHKQGVVHRDIKPSNILITPDGHIKITDFGIARLVGSDLTHTGTLLGTPHYMSPEQCEGYHVDGKADQFSLAIVLYEMITGEKPFPGESLPVVMQKIVKSTPLPPSELNVYVPKSLDNVIMRALEKNPNQRFPDMNEFANALIEMQRKEHIEPNPQIRSCKEILDNKIVGTEPKTPKGYLRRCKDMLVSIPRGYIFIGAGLTVITIFILVALSQLLIQNFNTKKSFTRESSSKEYFIKATFNIWRSQTQEAFEDYQNYLDLKRISNFITLVDHPLEVEIKNQDGEVIYKNTQYHSGETIEFQKPALSISWIIRVNGEEYPGELPPSIRPKSANEQLAKHILLPPVKK